MIEEMGSVLRIERGDPLRMCIRANRIWQDLVPGSSIAVDGACLTVTGLCDSSFVVEISPETVRSTHLGQLRPGQLVNLERPLRVGDRLGGHWVSGHVDGVGFIELKRPSGSFYLFAFSIPPSLAEYLVPKGSIAVDGISLTVVEVERQRFTVQVIPYTYRHTTLGIKRVGDPVNLEADLLAKYAKRLLQLAVGGGREILNQEFLVRHGFFHPYRQSSDTVE